MSLKHFWNKNIVTEKITLDFSHWNYNLSLDPFMFTYSILASVATIAEPILDLNAWSKKVYMLTKI